MTHPFRDPSATRNLAAALLLASLLGVPASARAQETLNDQLRKVLTDPEAMKELEKTKNLAPVEMFRTQVLPNDVLPFLKPNHWAVLASELRSNQTDYVGELETSRIPLEGMPQAMIYHREARLQKGKRTRLSFPVMIPRIPKEIELQVVRPDAIREDERWSVPLSLLEPHQMITVVLTRGPNSAYAALNKMAFNAPRSAAFGDQTTFARQRYYRLLLPEDPALPQLPNHPLGWTMISHVIWDGMAPDLLSVGQQEAMLDWLHWGGQLIIVGGAGPSFTPLAESFLGPYLPGRPNGNNAQLTSTDLAPFARKYHGIAALHEADDLLEDTQSYQEAWLKFGRRYDPKPSSINILKNAPLYLTGIEPKPGASVVRIGNDPKLPPLAVEARVGRGRIMMVGVNLVEPSLLSWPGYDSFVRRVLFRREEERMIDPLRYGPASGYLVPRYEFLNGPQLTWLRYHGRDLGAPSRSIAEEENQGVGRFSARPATPATMSYNPIDDYQVPVGEWLDSAALPVLSRRTLEAASGIEIPNSNFVMKVILGYVLCLVPINWLVCRYAFGRREWAWLIVPVLSIGFAVVVERAAAYDIGYDSTCDEIDLLETHGDYGRGHLSRFGSLYTTGRVTYSISFPDDPTGLALPMSSGRALRGEDVRTARFQSLPHPSLTDYQVQPRSLAMFRAEQMATLSGTPRLVEKNGTREIVNDTEFTIRDAVLVELGKGTSRAYRLGTIPAKGTVAAPSKSEETKEFDPGEIKGLGDKDTLNPKAFLALLVGSSISNRPEDRGELRLIGWTDKIAGGCTVEPTVDRHRGFTLFVAHLREGVIPDPDSIEYDALAAGPEIMPNVPPRPTPPASVFMRGGMMNTMPPPTPKRPLPPGAMPVPSTKDAEKSAPDPADAEIQSEDFTSGTPKP